MPSLYVDLHSYRLFTGTIARLVLDSHGKDWLLTVQLAALILPLIS